MKYKSQYPDSYTDGIRNKSFTLSGVSVQLLNDNEIENESAFVNDLIIEALQDKEFFKRRLLGHINAMAKEFETKFGKKVLIDLIDPEVKP